jgi:hypothetical protein
MRFARYGARKTVTYSAALKSTRMQDVIAAIDAGSGPGYMEIATAAYGTILSTITLSKPSFSESGAVITLLGVPKSDSSAANSGTAAIARTKDSMETPSSPASPSARRERTLSSTQRPSPPVKACK